MVPGALITVIPFLTANPERGLTCPSKPSGIAIAIPVAYQI